MAAFSKAPYGQGGRFKACKRRLAGKVKDPNAACAAIGRRAHGKPSFQKVAAAGRKRAK